MSPMIESGRCTNNPRIVVEGHRGATMVGALETAAAMVKAGLAAWVMVVAVMVMVVADAPSISVAARTYARRRHGQRRS